MPDEGSSSDGAVLLTVSGHTNSFWRVSDSEIWKLTDAPERDMLVRLMESPELRQLVPTYVRDVPLEHWRGREPDAASVCVQLQDLTASFGDSPCVMDIKLGVRTFLEDEVSNPKVRADLLAKMDKLDSSEATESERASGGITKLRYMQFRERASTSSSLGYRLEGLQAARAGPGEANGSAPAQVDMPSKEKLSKINTEEAVEELLRRFIMADKPLKEQYLQRLKAIHATLSSCQCALEREPFLPAQRALHETLARLRRQDVQRAPVHQHVATLRARRRVATLWRVDDRLQQGSAGFAAPLAHHPVGAWQPRRRVPLRAFQSDSPVGAALSHRGQRRQLPSHCICILLLA